MGWSSSQENKIGGVNMDRGKMELILSNHCYYENVADTGTTDVCSAQNLVEDTALSIDGAQPDVPRSLVLTVVDTTASITDGAVDCVGIDANGQLFTESVDISAGAGTYLTSHAFAEVISVTPNGMVGLGGSGDETLAVGFGDKLGLPMGLGCTLYEVYKEADDNATAVIGTVNKTYGTVIPTTTLGDGAHDVEFWYNFKAPLQ